MTNIKTEKSTRNSLLENCENDDSIVKQYKQTAYNTANLKRDEELDLIKKYKKDGCPEAKEKIINSYLRTVIFLAKRFQKGTTLSMIDLIHSGIVGICNGLEGFDLKQYKKSGGLFAYFIYRAILMELTVFYRTFLRQFSVTDSTNTKLLKINKLFKNGELNLKNDDQKKYIGTHLSLNDEEVEGLLSLFKPSIELDKSIEFDNGDSRVSEANSTEYKDLILKSDEKENPARSFEEKETFSNLNYYIDKLEPRERTIILYRYGINCKEHTLAQIGQKCKMSTGAVRIHVEKIQNKLKRMMIKNS